MKPKLGGLGKKGRSQLGTVLKRGGAVITVKAAAAALMLPSGEASQLLSGWCKKGWLSRVKRGIYVPIPLQSQTSAVMVDEPWVLAKTMFSPCYIGGWSAAEHWDFTEQIFNSVMVLTTKKVHERTLALHGARFQLKTVDKKRIFGTKEVWLQNQKVEVSDPSRTIIDVLNDPALAGGIRMSSDILSAYLRSTHKNASLLKKYADQLGNTAVYKRLGFLLEKTAPGEVELTELCKAKLKSGYSQLDPGTPGKKLVTRWGLWVPAGWEKDVPA